MTTTLEEAMSGVNNMSDMGKVIAEQLGPKGQSVSTPPPSPEGKTEEPDRTPLPTEGLSADEMDLFRTKPKRDQKDQGKEQPATIAGTPYQTPEALADGYKNLQRRVQQLTDSMKVGHSQQLKQEVRAEIERMLGEVPTPQPQESDEEKTLKSDDPEAYRVLQLEKQIAGQNKHLDQLMAAINGIKQNDQIREIQNEFRGLAEANKLPFDILMAYASIPQYANVPAEQVAADVKTLWENEIKKYAPSSKPQSVSPSATGNIRSPSSGGSTGIVNEPLTVDDIGIPGTKKFREFTQKKMAQIFRQRFAGGGA